MKKIFVIDCNPKDQSLSHGLFEQYIKGAQNAGHKVKSMRLSSMEFELDLAKQNEGDELEPSLIEFQENVSWCEHTVFVYPLWWGFMPAKMKGLIDRAFLPQFAYAYDGKSALPKKLLTGRSAEVLVTSDTPVWIFKFIYRAAASKIMSNQILGFVGFKPIKYSMFSQVISSDDKIRKQWLAKAWKLGNRVK